MNRKKKNILLLGPTASGKTAFAVRLAEKLDAEIISVDSRQVYRGLDIGSGKDISEYTLPGGKRIPYHLIDIVNPEDCYSLADFLGDTKEALSSIRERGKVPFFAGGTALFIHALLSQYELYGGTPDPEERERLRNTPLPELRKILAELDPSSETLSRESENHYRIIRKIELARASAGTPKNEKEKPLEGLDFLILGLYRERNDIRKRIEMRLDTRLTRENMLEEARYLHEEQGVSWERLESFGLEYRQMALHLQGKISYDEMRDVLLAKIRQFAKRQDSWFRKLERDGFDIHWHRPEEFEKALTLCEDYLNDKTIPEPSFRLSETYYGPVQEPLK